jgi:hypothetical protein
MVGRPSFCGLPLYLLIDPYFGEPSFVDLPEVAVQSLDQLREQRLAAWDRDVAIAENDRPLLDPLQLPYLVQLRGPQDLLIAEGVRYADQEGEQSISDGHGRFTIGAFIEADLPMPDVMARLEAMWSISHRGSARYFRLADPRIFEMITHLWTAEEIADWLGPFARWHFRSRSGEWRKISGAADEDSLQDEEALFRRAALREKLKATKPRLRLDEARVRKLELAEVVSRALTTWQGMEGRALPDDSHARAWAAAEAARESGLRHSDDLLACVINTFRDSAFARSRRAQRALALAVKEPGSYELHLGSDGVPNNAGSAS